jgi:hypothetical protein
MWISGRKERVNAVCQKLSPVEIHMKWETAA